MQEFARLVFSHLCHQEPARSWAPGGITLALCHRCAGVYIGAALTLLLFPLARFKPGKAVLLIHGLFILQMGVFGLHLVPHPGAIRTLSSQLFIIGAFYFLWLNIRFSRGLEWKHSSPRLYFTGVLFSLVFLQILVRLPFSRAAFFLDFLALFGLASILVLFFLTIMSFFRKSPRGISS